MKNTFLKYIKISLMLVLLMQAGKVEAQIKIPFTFGATTTFAGGTINIPASHNNTDVYFGCSELDNLTPWLMINNYAQVNFTVPAKSVIIELWGADAGDILHLDVNGVSYAVTPAMMNCGWLTCSGNNNCGSPIYSSDGNVKNPGPNAYRLTITPTTPISTFRITNAAPAVVSGFGLSNFTYTPCYAGTTAPTLSSTSISASCPANTANLNSLVTSTLPSGATLKWYTDAARTTEVTAPASVGVSGTYYAFYVDTVNNCFSPASAAVTVTANCPINVATVCPEVSIDLSTRVTSGTLPTGYTYTYHSATPATTANKLSSPVVSTSGTYYLSAYFATQDCYATTSRPMVVTITNCCAAVAAPNFN